MALILYRDILVRYRQNLVHTFQCNSLPFLQGPEGFGSVLAMIRGCAKISKLSTFQFFPKLGPGKLWTFSTFSGHFAFGMFPLDQIIERRIISLNIRHFYLKI